MNMIVKATEAACRFVLSRSRARGFPVFSGHRSEKRAAGGGRFLSAGRRARSFQVFSGYSSEKRAAGVLLAGGKGKRVVAGALLPAQVVKSNLHTTPERLVEMWHRTVVGHVQADRK